MRPLAVSKPPWRWERLSLELSLFGRTSGEGILPLLEHTKPYPEKDIAKKEGSKCVTERKGGDWKKENQEKEWLKNMVFNQRRKHKNKNGRRKVHSSFYSLLETFEGQKDTSFHIVILFPQVTNQWLGERHNLWLYQQHFEIQRTQSFSKITR